MVRTRYRTMDLFRAGKGVQRGCTLPPANFTYMQRSSCENAGLDESQAGFKTARRNINNLRYADDTTLKAESEEELESLDEGESRK